MRMFTLMTVGVLLTLTACAGPAGPASLDGTSWDVTQLNGAAPVAGSHPTMAFTADRMSGTTGCNSFSAGYTVKDSSITFSLAAQTAMACSEELMKQEAAFDSALAKVATFSRGADTMQLSDASGQTLFTLAKAASPSPKPLEGTTWQLDSIRTGETAASVVAGSSVTMQIADGKLSGKACNTFNATVTITGQSITVGPVVSTRMACVNPEETKQEQAVLDLLGKATGTQITGNHLWLSTDSGDGLDFTAQ